MTARARLAAAWRWLAARERRIGVMLAALLIAVGLFPGPWVILPHDPNAATDLIVRYFGDQTLYRGVGTLLIVIPAIVLASALGGRFDDAAARTLAAIRSMPTDRFVTIVAIVATAGSAMIAVYTFFRRPTTADEIAQLWHARILLTGRLSLPADPNPEFFALDNVVDAGRWYSQFPIGGPAAFALASLVRAGWLLNPLLAGQTVINVHRFAADTFDEGIARASAVLMAISPFALMMSGTFMNHTLVLWLASIALASLPRWMARVDARPLARHAAVIGLALGAAITVRPLDGAVAAAAFGGMMLIHTIRARARARILSLGWGVVGGAIPIALLLVANARTTGDPLLFGYEVLWGANHSLGFHADPSGSMHTPWRGTIYAVKYLAQFNWVLLEWAVPGLLVVAAGLVAVGRPTRWGWLLLGWAALQILAYAAYWHSGFFLGPRFLYTVLPVFIIFAAIGVVSIVRRAELPVRRAALAAVAASIAVTLTLPMTPYGTLGQARSARTVRAGFKLDIDRVIAPIRAERALILANEVATSRLSRRLWGLGISRPDAARLMRTADHCALFDAAMNEAEIAGAPAERLARLNRVRRFEPAAGYEVRAPDPSFRVSDSASVTPRCAAELSIDLGHSGSVAYGPLLLRNQLDSEGRIAGEHVFVADMGEYNEVLRERFADRKWYRLELPRGSVVPVLTPYESPVPPPPGDVIVPGASSRPAPGRR